MINMHKRYAYLPKHINENIIPLAYFLSQIVGWATPTT